MFTLSTRLLLLICMMYLPCEMLAKGLVVVPGLGRSDRIKTVVANLRLLEPHLRKEWDCTVYIYAIRSDELFWSNGDQLTYIKSLCKIVENPNGLVTENLHLLNPASINTTYDMVFIVLDDCKLSSPFDLSDVLRTMEYNNLTVISPQVYNLIRSFNIMNKGFVLDCWSQCWGWAKVSQHYANKSCSWHAGLCV